MVEYIYLFIFIFFISWGTFFGNALYVVIVLIIIFLIAVLFYFLIAKALVYDMNVDVVQSFYRVLSYCILEMAVYWGQVKKTMFDHAIFSSIKRKFIRESLLLTKLIKTSVQ